MGKRPAEVELFVGNMGSIQREIRSSMQREETPTMETGLERIAAKARCEPELRFTSLAHHITRERVWENLVSDSKRSAPGWMARRWRRRRRALADGSMQRFNPFTARDIERRTSGEYISRSPVSRRSAPWAFLVSPTGRFSAAPRRCYLPSTSRTFCHVLLVAGLGGAPIMPGNRSMR